MKFSFSSYSILGFSFCLFCFTFALWFFFDFLFCFLKSGSPLSPKLASKSTHRQRYHGTSGPPASTYPVLYATPALCSTGAGNRSFMCATQLSISLAARPATTILPVLIPLSLLKVISSGKMLD